eukprot:GHVN01076555.1.p1 GENE.GHVN01076555.1~~GHVN01076555.1.p1  ORF type:complete len:603 (+),score=78.78 GHVN01076555.1:169-1977(+)
MPDAFKRHSLSQDGRQPFMGRGRTSSVDGRTRATLKRPVSHLRRLLCNSVLGLSLLFLVCSVCASPAHLKQENERRHPINQSHTHQLLTSIDALESAKKKIKLKVERRGHTLKHTARNKSFKGDINQYETSDRRQSKLVHKLYGVLLSSRNSKPRTQKMLKQKEDEFKRNVLLFVDYIKEAHNGTIPHDVKLRDDLDLSPIDFSHTHFGHVESAEFIKRDAHLPTVKADAHGLIEEFKRLELRIESERVKQQLIDKTRDERVKKREETRQKRKTLLQHVMQIDAKPLSTGDHAEPHHQDTHPPSHSSSHINAEVTHDGVSHLQLNSGVSLTSHGGSRDPSGCTETRCDNRENGCAGPTENQGDCGCCWAFSSLHVVASSICQQFTNSFYPLSVQEVVDCEGEYSCTGGHFLAAMDYLREKKRVANWDEYDYESAKGTCQADSHENAFQLGDGDTVFEVGEPRKISPYKQLHEEVNLVIATWIRRFGAVYATVEIDMTQPDWRFNDGTVIINHCNPSNANHAIAVVGYNMDMQEKGKRYWVIKNSWGPEWGDGGFAYLDMDACPTSIESDNYGVFHEAVLLEVNKASSNGQIVETAHTEIDGG